MPTPSAAPAVLTALAVLTLVPQPAAAADGPARPPDPEVLAKAARRSAEQFAAGPVSWTVRHPANTPGATFVVRGLKSGDKARYVLTFERSGAPTLELLRIIVRRDVWHVVEAEGVVGRFRPYEAPLNFNAAWLYLAKSQPAFLTDPDDLRAAKFVEMRGPVAVYSKPLPESVQKMLRNRLDEVDHMSASGTKIPPEVSEMAAKIRQMLDRGHALEIRAADGVVVRQGALNKLVDTTEYGRPDAVADGEFDVGGRDWPDFTDDPTAGGAAELVMAAQCGIFQKGMKDYELDARLIDLRTGRYRRIPFPGPVCLPCCFLKGRTAVAVNGFDLDGSAGVYRVDLKTGDSRRIGGAALQAGMTFGGGLSPDGTTLAVMHQRPADQALKRRVFLVDLATDRATPVGEPIDAHNVSWLPDGKGLLMVEKVYRDLNENSTDWIVRMDLPGGRVTRIRKGEMAVLLADRILFRDAESRLWRTCNLEGGDERPFAGGLPGHAFPSPAPDGKRLLMQKRDSEKVSFPVQLESGKAEGRPIVDGPGAWAVPIWR